MKFFHELFHKAILAFWRFPVCMLWAVVSSAYFIIAIGNDVDLFEDNFRWEMTFILGISWLIGAAFFEEQFDKPKKLSWIKLLVIILLGLYYWWLPQSEEEANIAVLTRWWLLLLAGHIFVFFAPFVKSWNDVAFWNYLKNILVAIGRSILFSAVLYGGLALALVASDTLFSLDIEGSVYGQLFVVCLGIVNTCIYLADFPRDVQTNRTFLFNKALSVFVKFILLPLLLLYFIILYIYGFKILLSWELPQGWLASLISALALIGFIVQIMINPWVEKSSVLIRRFHPWFYILILPILILLFVAVFRRIADYNLTEPRYFLMVLSFWILGVCLYLIFAKKRQMRFLPISLFILILLSCFGPWGAFELSLKAQYKEFNQIYSEIMAGERKIENEKAQRFQSIVYYFAKRDELDKLNPILGFNANFEDDYMWDVGWEILDSLNVEILPSEDLGVMNNHYFHFYRHDPFYLQGVSYSAFAELQRTRHMGENPISDAIHMEWDNAEIKVFKSEQLLFSLRMDSLLRASARSNYNMLQEKPEKLVFDINATHQLYKLVFTEFSYTTRNDSIFISDAKGYLFFISEAN